MALNIVLTDTPRKYMEKLDRTLQKRIANKLEAIVKEPDNFALSKPLAVSTQRSARVGDYRILFTVSDKELLVVEIGPRGQIYRSLSK